MTDTRNIVLFDSEEAHLRLRPLSFTRPIPFFRLGIETILEKWEALLPGKYHLLPPEYLRPRFGSDAPADALHIASHFIPTPELAEALAALKPGETLTDGEETIAFFPATEKEGKTIELPDCRKLVHHFDIFRENPAEIEADFRRLTKERKSQVPGPGCTVLGPHTLPDGTPAIFIEEGATIECASINTKEGPVYIGRDATVMEGSLLRGPMALCHDAKIRMGSKIYGGSTFGPHSKAGGEIDNAVIFGYSNKSHDGYLGNAVIGEWCNIGAGTNASNLKNDYSKIRVWDYATGSFLRTDLQFCGLIMGDHSKTGVNCMLNTATVVGVGVNIHGAGFPRTLLRSFTEGSPQAGFEDIPVKRFFSMVDRMMQRRGHNLTEEDCEIFEEIHRMER